MSLISLTITEIFDPEDGEPHQASELYFALAMNPIPNVYLRVIDLGR